MSTNYLSHGGQGILFTNNERVFKYGLTKNLVKEYQFMQQLPKLKCFYNHSVVSLNCVNKDEIKEINLKYPIFEYLNIRNYENFEYSVIVMDQIPMRSLKQILSSYRPFRMKQLNTELKIIDEQVFVNLVRSLYKLYDDVKLLNKKYGMYHNDISESNIMCSESGDQIYLIDFGMSANTNFDCFDDLISIEYILGLIISVGLTNNDVYEKIINDFGVDELLDADNMCNWIEIRLFL
jgi:serine/threonine protein kinase